MVKTIYTLDEFIRDIAFASYATTFIEVLADYLNAYVQAQGKRAQIGIDKDYLEALIEIIPSAQFRLGTTDEQTENDIKAEKEIKQVETKYKYNLSREALKPKSGVKIREDTQALKPKSGVKIREDTQAYKNYKDELKRLNGVIFSADKREKAENYGIYPVSISFDYYTKLIKDLRNIDQPAFELGVYNITDSLKKKFLFDSGLKNLSKTISPDWVEPVNDSGEWDEKKNWEYIPDPNIRLKASTIPYKGFRGGYKLIVVSKTEIEKLIDSNKKNIMSRLSIQNDTDFDTWKKNNMTKFVNKKDSSHPSSYSEKNMVAFIKFSNDKLTLNELLAQDDNINAIGKITDYYPENDDLKNKKIKDIRPYSVDECHVNLFDDMKDFISDYRKFKVKQTAESVNLLIPEKNIPVAKLINFEKFTDTKTIPQQLAKSSEFAKKLMVLQLDKIRSKLYDEESVKLITQFNLIIENF